MKKTKFTFTLLLPLIWLVELLLSDYILAYPWTWVDVGILYLVFLIFRLFFLNFFDLFKISWRFVSIRDLVNFIVGFTLAQIVGGIAAFTLISEFKFRHFLLDYITGLFLSLGFLSLKRVYLRLTLEREKNSKRRAIVIGDPESVERFLRNLEDSGFLHTIKGIVLTERGKKGGLIRGVKIIGDIEELSYILRSQIFDTIYIIENSLPSSRLKSIIWECERRHVNLKIVSVDIAYKHGSIFTIRDVDTEELLFRSEVKIHSDTIEKFISHKKILITGAAGSIGSELSYQIARFTPLKLILLDIDETNVYLLYKRLRDKFPYLEIDYIVASITDKEKLERIFQKNPVNLVFHAAAYKHVPVLERFPEEALKTNVLGTFNVASISGKYKVERFILISTDKAVKPVSVMGASKRIAEKIVMSLQKEFPSTKYIVVRFGNVLGSRGSVIPIFTEQIREGGPITITHPEMERFFMTTREAVLLVLEAGAIGEGGEIFVLDMGKPVKIIDLAKELIKLHGLEPERDIKIKYTGIRPGEKLKEELYSEDEELIETELEKLMKLKPQKTPELDLSQFFKEVQMALKENDAERIKKILFKYV